MKERTKAINSPFRYPGGKFYARKQILPLIPKHSVYCEPFAGGASIFLAKELADKNYLNDLDKELINCYRQIKNNLPSLLKEISGFAATPENHQYFKFSYDANTNIKKAARWFYLNRTSFSGIMKMSNNGWGYGEKYSMPPERWPAMLENVSKRIKNVTFSSLDFEEVIEDLPKGTFAFIDPPYYNARQDKLYTCSFKKDDHIRLSKCLYRARKKITFLLTYDNSDEISEMYDWCNSSATTWNYTLARTDDQIRGLNLSDGFKSNRSLGKELFLSNYTLYNIPKKIGVPRAQEIFQN